MNTGRKQLLRKSEGERKEVGGGDGEVLYLNLANPLLLA